MIIVKYYLYTASRKEEEFYFDAFLAVLANINQQEPRCGCKPRFKKTRLLTLSAKRDSPALQQIYEKRSI